MGNRDDGPTIEGFIPIGASPLSDILHGMGRGRKKDKPLASDVQETILKSAFKQFTTEVKFKAGDLITPKRGLEHYSIFDAGDPCIVMEVIDPPIINNRLADFGTNHFLDRDDLRIGSVGSDGNVSVFAVDSRYFEHYKVEKATETA